MPIALSPAWTEKFLHELNADELKVYLHLSASAAPRTWTAVPEPPRFAGKATDTSDPAADLKRFRAAMGGLKLKDIVEVDGEGGFRMPYLSAAGVHEAERQVPSARERAELWQELQQEIYEAVRLGPSRDGFLSVLDIMARYLPQFDDGLVALQRDGADRSAAFFDERSKSDMQRAREQARTILAKVDDPSPTVMVEAARHLTLQHVLPAAAVWSEVAEILGQLAPMAPAGPPALTDEELGVKWDDVVTRLFAAYVGRPTKMGFLRLLQVAFMFALQRLPDGDPEELFTGLREPSVERFQSLLDGYFTKALDVVEADAARSVTDEDLLAGRAWEHAKRLSAKHEVPVEVAMDHLVARESEVRRSAERDDFDPSSFEAPDISGMSKEEGEMAWIESLAPSVTQKEAFHNVLRRLRRAKKGYLERAIMAYCRSIIELLDEHGMLDNPTDEILDNIVATINEQTAYFRDQYFALTVDPVEPEDVRRVLHALSTERS